MSHNGPPFEMKKFRAGALQSALEIGMVNRQSVLFGTDRASRNAMLTLARLLKT